MLSRRRKSHPRGRGRAAGGAWRLPASPATDVFIFFPFERTGGVDQPAAGLQVWRARVSRILRCSSGEARRDRVSRSRHLISGLRARVPVPEQGASTRIRSNFAVEGQGRGGIQDHALRFCGNVRQAFADSGRRRSRARPAQASARSCSPARRTDRARSCPVRFRAAARSTAPRDPAGGRYRD